MTTNTTADLYNTLCKSLALDTRTIVFHMIDDGPMAGGMVQDLDALETSDAFCDLADVYSDDAEIYIPDVVTYMLGSGEADAATREDLDALEKIRDRSPREFARMLYEFADVPATLEDITVANPYYNDEN